MDKRVQISWNFGKPLDVSWGGYEIDMNVGLCQGNGELKVRHYVAEGGIWKHHNSHIFSHFFFFLAGNWNGICSWRFSFFFMMLRKK